MITSVNSTENPSDVLTKAVLLTEFYRLTGPILYNITAKGELWDLVLVCCVCVCVKIVCIQFLQYFRRFKMCQQNVGMSTFSDTKCGHEHFFG